MVNRAIKGGSGIPADSTPPAVPIPAPVAAPETPVTPPTPSTPPRAARNAPPPVAPVVKVCAKCKGTGKVSYKDPRGVALEQVCQTCQPGKK